jgi:cellulose synthase/poly-beta-1,6-N-acetylglucosamine synthase-like glycosyltransferase
MEPLIVSIPSLMRHIAWRQSTTIIVVVFIIIWRTALRRVGTRNTSWLLIVLLLSITSFSFIGARIVIVGLDIFRTEILKNVNMKLNGTYALTFLKIPGSLSF